MNGNPRGEGEQDSHSFGLRFGFGYRVGSNTVIRGGYGVFFSSMFFDTTSYNSVGTFNAVTNYVSSNDGGATLPPPLATTISNPFSNGLVTPVRQLAGTFVADQVPVALSSHTRQLDPGFGGPWRTCRRALIRTQTVIAPSWSDSPAGDA